MQFVFIEFFALKDFFFKDQISSAAVSIANNMAVGFDGKTNHTS